MILLNLFFVQLIQFDHYPIVEQEHKTHYNDPIKRIL